FLSVCSIYSFFFFTDPSNTDIYTLSLHDALPIFGFVTTQRRCMIESRSEVSNDHAWIGNFDKSPVLEVANPGVIIRDFLWENPTDRKSTRLNSSHVAISYAVFCLKKKNKI